MEVKYPREVATAMELLERSGYAAYVVGGALRDALLGREAHDFDVTTAARPEDMARIFRGYPVIETGLAHGTLTGVSGLEASRGGDLYRSGGGRPCPTGFYRQRHGIQPEKGTGGRVWGHRGPSGGGDPRGGRAFGAV